MKKVEVMKKLKSEQKGIMGTKEECFNIFHVYNKESICCEIGIAIHELSGDDNSKFKQLQEKVNNDWDNCTLKFKIKPIGYNVSQLDEMAFCYLEELGFILKNPLKVSTPIHDGKPYFVGSISNYFVVGDNGVHFKFKEQ